MRVFYLWVLLLNGCGVSWLPSVSLQGTATSKNHVDHSAGGPRPAPKRRLRSSFIVTATWSIASERARARATGRDAARDPAADRRPAAHPCSPAVLCAWETRARVDALLALLAPGAAP